MYEWILLWILNRKHCILHAGPVIQCKFDLIKVWQLFLYNVYIIYGYYFEVQLMWKLL